MSYSVPLVRNPFCRQILFSFISSARSVTMSPLSGFQNFIDSFCPLLLHFPFFVLVGLYPFPLLSYHFSELSDHGEPGDLSYSLEHFCVCTC